MPSGDLVLFVVVCGLALALAEMEVRQSASLQWLCLALIWLCVMGMTIWLAYG